MKELNDILLVDDDPEDSSLFAAAFSETLPGKTLRTARNSEELFQQLTTFKPGAIFLDINMPGRDGYHCLQKLRSEPEFSEILVIMYTTSASERFVDSATIFGADLYIKKPVYFDDLKLMLHKVFEMDASELKAREPMCPVLQ